LYGRLVSLPLYPSMTTEQVDYIIQTVREIARSVRKKETTEIAEIQESAASVSSLAIL
jgi:hypothetical protein